MARQIQADITLKTDPGCFRSIWRGQKTAELRKDDRGYQVGDRIRLMEHDRKEWISPHREILIEVTHIVDVERWVSLTTTDHWVVLSFKVLGKKIHNWRDTKLCRGCRGERS